MEGKSPVDSNYVTRDKAKGMLLEILELRF
jgi:hypothetical protein